MKKLIIGIILVLLLISQAQAVQTSVEKTLIASEYGWLGDKVGFGDRYYKVTYNDGTSIIQRIRSGSLLPAYITYVPPIVEIPVGGDPSGKFKVPTEIEGVSCTLSGSTANNHYFEFSYVGSGGYNAVIGGLFIIVPCGTFRTTQYYPYVDNTYIGAIINTPGDYNLKLTETVKLSSGMVITDNRLFTVRVVGTIVTPTPTPISSSGIIRVASNVPGTVYIDNSAVGITGNEFKVSAGGHDVKVSQSGYTTYTRTVTVDNGATIDVFATLTKIPTGTPTSTPPTGQGSITIKSNVPGTVYIDGINKGTTGNTFTVDAGGHDIRVTASGYNSYSTSITVDYGTTKVVDVTLTALSSGGGTPTATPVITKTGTPTTTITSGTGGWAIVYRGVDIRYEDRVYYVGDIPHDSIAEAKKTIDDMIAGKEEKQSIFADIDPIWGLAAAIVIVGGGYVLLSKKKGKSKKEK